jgi:hypothetical protein
VTFIELFKSDQWRVGLKFKAWDKLDTSGFKKGELIRDAPYLKSEYSIHLVGTVNDLGGVCDDCSFPQDVIVEIIV